MFKISKLLLVPAIILLAGCSFAPIAEPTPVPTPTLSPTPRPTGTATPSPTASPSPTATELPKISLSLVNDTGVQICAVAYYPEDFEGGVLPNAVTKPPLEVDATLETELDPGTYNFDVWNCQGKILQSVRNYALTEPLSWNLSETLIGAPAETVYVNVVNNRSYDLCEFYISPAGSGDWGKNLLSPEYGFVITANSNYIEWIAPGDYDLLIRDCSGNVAAEKYNLTIPQNMTWTLKP